MKIAVTGATGFIGRYVVNELLTRNQEVVIATSNPNFAAADFFDSKISVVHFDLSNPEKKINYYKAFNQPDILVHIAWQDLPNYNEAFHVDKNLPLHIHFLENIISNGLSQLVVTGTCMEYGLQSGELSEELEARPVNYYAKAKNDLRIFLQYLQALIPYTLQWLRLFYTYGEGQNSKAILSQLQNAITKGDKEFNMSAGNQLRDYLPVEKTAEYICDIALQQKVAGIINCCSAQPITINSLVDNYLTTHKASIILNKGFYPYPKDEPLNFWGNNDKLKSILNNE